MIQGNMTIIAAGPVQCGLCPTKTDDDGKPVEKDGLVLEVDSSEIPLCWKHVRAYVGLRAKAKPKREPITPQFPAMATNGQD